MKLVDKSIAEGSDEVALTSLELTFNQESDCLSSDEDQTLNVIFQGDNEKFFTISTERWSFNSIDDLIEVIQTVSKLKI